MASKSLSKKLNLKKKSLLNTGNKKNLHDKLRKVNLINLFLLVPLKKMKRKTTVDLLFFVRYRYRYQTLASFF